MAISGDIRVPVAVNSVSPAVTENSTSTRFSCRVEHLPIGQQRNVLGDEKPLYQQHIELTPRPLTDIRIATTGLTGDPDYGSVSEVELTFQRGHYSGHVSHALGGTRLQIAAAGDAEAVRLGESLIVAGQNLLTMLEYAKLQNGHNVAAKGPEGVTNGELAPEAAPSAE